MTDQSQAIPAAPLTMRGAVFEAFRQREQKGVLTKATIGMIVLMVLIFAAFAVLMWPLITDLMAWTNHSQMPNASSPDPSALPGMPPAAFFWMFPAIFVFLFFFYLAAAAYEAACLRWLVRGESGGIFFGLTLSADTWRIWLGYWIWAFSYFGVIYFIEFGAIIIGLAVGFSVASAGHGDQVASGFAGAAAGGLFAIGALCAYLWVVVRFAPAAALCVAEKRFAFFDAWLVTRGRFWPLLGSFLLVSLINFIVLMAVEFGRIGYFGWQTVAMHASAADPQAAMAIMTRPINVVVMAVLFLGLMAASVLFHLSMFGINARVVMIARAQKGLPA